MSEDPIDKLQESYLRVKALAIEEAKAKGRGWDKDIIGKSPFVEVTLSLDDIRRMKNEDLVPYFIDRFSSLHVESAGYFQLLLVNPEYNVAYRGFVRERSPAKGSFTYEEALKNIRKYGFEKPTEIPSPNYPSWVGDLDTALSHAGVNQAGSVDQIGFLLAYKGDDSIVFDPWDYKEHGVRFDHAKVKSDPDLKTWKGRLVGVIEIKFT